jgi:hypothetical protein
MAGTTKSSTAAPWVRGRIGTMRLNFCIMWSRKARSSALYCAQKACSKGAAR